MHSDNESRAAPVRLTPLLIVMAGSGLLAILVFSGTLGHTLLEFDDNVYVYENPLIYPLSLATIVRIVTTPYFRSYTPLTLLSHAVDYDLWGMNAFGHHLTNVVLHGINAALLAVLALVVFGIRRMGPDERITDLRTFLVEHVSGSRVAAPLLASLLFAVHPMRVESVAWVSDRKDLLLGLFVLPSITAYLLYAQTRGTALGRRLFVVSLVLAALAMLSKTIATMLPLVFLLLDAIPLRPHGRVRNRLSLLKEKAPFFACSIFVGIMSIVAVQGVLRHPVLYHPTVLEKLMQPTYALAFYLVKTVWPFGLTPMYTSGSLPSLLGALGIVVVLTIICIRAAVRGKGDWLLAWGTYVLFVVPTVIGKPAAGIQAWADRYSYLPAVPLMIIAGALCGAGLRSLRRLPGGVRVRHVALGLSIVVLAGLTTLSLRQIPLWHDDEVLWRYAIRVDREAVMAHTNLAMILTAKGRPDEAIAAADSAIALKPTYASAFGAKGLAFDLKADTARAIEAYQRAIVLDSNYIDAYSNLGNIYLQSDRYDEAIALYESAIARDPTFFSAYYNMGIAYYRRGDLPKAMEVFTTTTAVNPIYPNTYFNMGIIFSDWGDQASARQHFQRAADLGYGPAKKLLSPGQQTR
jgi:Tfp pilus assembly protein PilF